MTAVSRTADKRRLIERHQLRLRYVLGDLGEMREIANTLADAELVGLVRQALETLSLTERRGEQLLEETWREEGL